MRDYITLGPAPPGEDCSQVGSDNYRTNAIRECQAYIQAIRNYLGQEPDGAQLSYKSFPHDFGAYYEVVCYFDPANEKAMDYAYNCEGKGPYTWADGSVKAPIREGGSRRGR